MEIFVGKLGLVALAMRQKTFLLSPKKKLYFLQTGSTTGRSLLTGYICHSHEIIQLNEAINNELYKVEKLLEGNKLSLNVVKTCAMLISTKQKYKALQNQGRDLRVKIKGTELDTDLNTRYHGVNIDSSLDWKEHMKVISPQVSTTNGFLKRARNFLPQDTHSTQEL